jgi:hypothetical protein
MQRLQTAARCISSFAAVADIGYMNIEMARHAAVTDSDQPLVLARPQHGERVTPLWSAGAMALVC